MESAQRIITEIPLCEIWDDSGSIRATQIRDLSSEQIKELLRVGSVRFMVADVGCKPRWIPETERFAFWTTEVKSHLAEPGQKAYREDFPGEYCYFASEWREPNGSPIVVLICSH